MRAHCTCAVLFAAVLGAGCETAPPSTAAADPSAKAATNYCAREARTGSNLPSKECAAPQSEAERQKALENMRAKNPTTSTVRSSSGG